jgi:hypothetical protein
MHPTVVWDGSWQSVSAWRCRSCRVAGWDAKAELAAGCCAFGRVEGGVGRGSCAVRLGIDWLGSIVARRALNRTKREASARRQMAEALRWLSEARRQHCYVYGPLPIAARGICPVARELGARGKIASGCVSTYLKLWMEGRLRLRFIASSAWLRTAAPSPLAPKGRSVLACSMLTTV